MAGFLKHRCPIAVKWLSVSDEELFAGANSFAIQTPDDDWEIIQARDIELIGAGRYRLSHLLRGQLGTESAMQETLPASAPIVYLSDGLQQVDMSLSDLQQPYYWRYGPTGDTVGSDRFTTKEHAFKGRGLVPLSPVHARWTIEANGDHAIRWIRRTRIDGDSWDLYQVPLGEEQEAYEIEIVSTSNELKRTISTNAPSITYSQADRVADLGGADVAYQIRVYQMSALVGRGEALAAKVC